MTLTLDHPNLICSSVQVNIHQGVGETCFSQKVEVEIWNSELLAVVADGRSYPSFWQTAKEKASRSVGAGTASWPSGLYARFHWGDLGSSCSRFWQRYSSVTSSSILVWVLNRPESVVPLSRRLGERHTGVMSKWLRLCDGTGHGCDVMCTTHICHLLSQQRVGLSATWRRQ